MTPWCYELSLTPDTYRRLRVAVSHANLKARQVGSPGVLTFESVKARFDYWRNLCWVCGAPATSIDHVIPFNEQGMNVPANIRPACRRCNTGKGGFFRKGHEKKWQRTLRTGKKVCPKCGIEKLAEDFYPNSGTLDGRDGLCRACKQESKKNPKPRKSFLDIHHHSC